MSHTYDGLYQFEVKKSLGDRGARFAVLNALIRPWEDGFGSEKRALGPERLLGRWLCSCTPMGFRASMAGFFHGMGVKLQSQSTVMRSAATCDVWRLARAIFRSCA